MATEKIPLVSVIISMYNSAKFIPQTLESLLYQTMTDFEVIVIDDCSTDNSVEVVESFKQKFAVCGGGVLHVVKLQENSGTPGLPRNVGISFARGKYIAFLDSDDLFTKTALEELSTLAENYQADVVHTDTFFLQYEGKALTVCQRQKLPVVPEPIFETKDIAQRIRYWVGRGYNWESVTMFCKRDFLIRNQIQFAKIRNYEDMLFSFAVLCFAEKFFRIPNLTYIYKQRSESISHEHESDNVAKFNNYLRVLKDGFNAYEKIMDSVSFFEKNPNYRYVVQNFFFNEVSPHFFDVYKQFSPVALNPLVVKELSSDATLLSAYLFNMVNIHRLQIMQLQQELKRLQNK